MKEKFYVLCENIRSLENIGSIFRTADALAVNKLFLSGISGKPPRSKISKTALGAENFVEWEYSPTSWRIIEKLKKQGVMAVALEITKKSSSIYDFKPKFPLVLVLGNEVKGVSKAALKRADVAIHLPMRGKKESLNVAVAFGAAGYLINKYRK